MTTDSDRLSRVFGALADPTRRDILDRLSGGPTTVGELARHYTVSRPAVSQHLSVLEKAGLIARTPSAQWRECRVCERGLDEAADWIAQQRIEWTQRFDLLEERLAARRKDDR